MALPCGVRKIRWQRHRRKVACDLQSKAEPCVTGTNKEQGTKALQRSAFAPSAVFRLEKSALSCTSTQRNSLKAPSPQGARSFCKQKPCVPSSLLARHKVPVPQEHHIFSFVIPALLAGAFVWRSPVGCEKYGGNATGGRSPATFKARRSLA